GGTPAPPPSGPPPPSLAKSLNSLNSRIANARLRRGVRVALRVGPGAGRTGRPSDPISETQDVSRKKGQGHGRHAAQSDRWCEGAGGPRRDPPDGGRRRDRNVLGSVAGGRGCEHDHARGKGDGGRQGP